MKIKQQKQIKEFLAESFGNDRGGKLFEMQDKALGEIIGNTKGKTENQMKTLIQTILPRIALYKSFIAAGLSDDDVYKYMRKYMLEIVAAKKHSSTVKMEIVPGFYAIYSRVFLKIMRTTDLQESVQEHGKDYFNVTITKCLWHTACVENGCEELCRLFCDVDDVTYGGLKKIGFTRTKTLGYGGDCCDFHMFRK
ncbi:L-2-amino-thiazoline-4-carboxylic acid hydrolase [Ruminococcus bicirculans (ex Wegman et al. 2014)]|uniref:L-2-amino-thiazoline-4-carboxylic acid hydrolase n=2 Tax=Ruminococcus bicirculans (ex Wegman et al. 2014) TaxID=1160721 RepID=UPI00242DF87E|nr:L-2-amino-thiazoline-4-carboxylic acid hydrolase [Ruminococcus bicirculans (ex Wegman et al. 2014)]